jgi:hypothetical protein
MTNRIRAWLGDVRLHSHLWKQKRYLRRLQSKLERDFGWKWGRRVTEEMVTMMLELLQKLQLGVEQGVELEHLRMSLLHQFQEQFQEWTERLHQAQLAWFDRREERLTWLRRNPHEFQQQVVELIKRRERERGRKLKVGRKLQRELLHELTEELELAPGDLRLRLERVGQKSSVTQGNPCITVLFRFLDERERVEWIGDLYEMRRQWQGQGLSPWIIHFRTSRIALQLLRARVHCMVYDRIFARYWEKS